MAFSQSSSSVTPAPLDSAWPPAHIWETMDAADRASWLRKIQRDRARRLEIDVAETQQDKRSPECHCTKLFEDYKKWYDSLETEECASENSDSSGTTGSSQTSRLAEEDRALPPAVKPESRRDRSVRFDLTAGRKSPEPIQLIQNNQAHSTSPQQITGEQKEKSWPSRRARSMTRKRKGHRKNLDDSSSLITPRKTGFRSKAS